MTALSNDHGYEEVYLRQIQRCLSPLDLVVAVSSSGRSENILRAARYAADAARVVTFSGMAQDNPLRELGHVNAYIPFSTYGAVEIGHLAILHECAARAFRVEQ